MIREFIFSCDFRIVKSWNRFVIHESRIVNSNPGIYIYNVWFTKMYVLLLEWITSYSCTDIPCSLLNYIYLRVHFKKEIESDENMNEWNSIVSVLLKWQVFYLLYLEILLEIRLENNIQHLKLMTITLK